MDPDLLKEKGFNPVKVSLAYLDDYGLIIGERATLCPKENARAFGTVMELEVEELRQLYAGDGVVDYLPQTVKAVSMDGQSMDTLSYILPMDKTSGSNREYATKLAGVAKKLGLPDSYVEEIEAWI